MYLLATPPPACLCVLGHRNHSLQGVESLTQQITLLHQRNLLLHSGPDPEELAHFMEGSAEAGADATLPNPRIG